MWRTRCAHICDAGKPYICAHFVPCVCYGLAFERDAAGSRARHTTNARAGSRAHRARDATHRRIDVYIDARDARNRRSNATDARSDGINTRGREGRRRFAIMEATTTTTTTGANARDEARRSLKELGEREFLDDLVRGDARTRERGRNGGY